MKGLAILALVLFAVGCSSSEDPSGSDCATAVPALVVPEQYGIETSAELAQFEGLALAVLSFESVEAAEDRFSVLTNPDRDVIEALGIVGVRYKPPDLLLSFESVDARDEALCWLGDSANTGDWAVESAQAAELTES